MKVQLCLLTASSLASPVRVIHGKSAHDGQFPHQVTLKSSSNHYCGGSILSSLKVLTAAQCYQAKLATCTAGAGSVRINSQRQERPLASQTRHPEWNAQTKDFDFMMIAVKTPWKFDSYTKPAQLAAIEGDEEWPLHTPLETSGYGYTELVGGFPAVTASTLKYLNMEYILRSPCKSYWAGHTVGWNQVCAYADNATPCDGDTGGPLMVREGGVWKLLGNFSWTHSRCRTEQYPAVFSNNADPDIRAWILRHL